MSTSPKVLLITGSNTGLGYATVSAILGGTTPYHVILCARSQEKADQAVQKLEQEHGSTKSKLTGMVLDYASDEDIAALVDRVTEEVGRLDVIVHNGGTQFDPSWNQGKSNMTERQMWNATWDINVSGPWLLTKSFAPLLIKSGAARVIFITSGLAPLSFQPTSIPSNKSPPPGWPKDPKTLGLSAYRSAKTGLIQAMLQLRRLLREDGVRVMALSPGLLATGLGGVGADYLRKIGAVEVEDGAEVVRRAIEGERDEDAEKGVLNKDGNQPW